MGMREAATVMVEARTGAQIFFFFVSFAISDSLSSNSSKPRYYCDYCDTYLTHDSPSVRKKHNARHKHKYSDLVQETVRSYNQQNKAQLNKILIDQKVKEHLGAFRPPVASNVRHGLPVLPIPLLGKSQ